QYEATDLPFQGLRFDGAGQTFFAAVDGVQIRCVVAESNCQKFEAPQRGARNQLSVSSPDKKWEALISNYNLAVRRTGSRELTFLSSDGSEGNYYDAQSIAWSPDSQHLAVYRVRPGYRREVHYIESSPEDQLQPKFSAIVYAKPGDVLDFEQPVLFDLL